MRRTRKVLVPAAAISAVVAGAFAGPATSDTERVAAALTMNASLSLSSQFGKCEPVAGADGCAVRTIEGPFPGLGQVTGGYEFYVNVGPPTCDDGNGRAFGYPIRFTVAGKGEIQVVVAAGQCVITELIRTQTQTFTVTGGTGIYAGATGSGTLGRALGSETPTGRHGREIWQGTLTVPGLEFDITPPRLIGAIAKHVRAPRTATRVRVTYAVTAQDDVDGTVLTTCRPKSGSRFRIGRTVVTCTAVDKSANTGTARFTVTAVRRG